MTVFLILIVVVLGVLALARLVKVFELANSLKKQHDPGEVPQRDIRLHANLMLIFVFAFLIFCIGSTIMYAPYLLPPAASAHGEGWDTLMNFNLVVIAFVFVITHLLLFYFTWKYQYRPDRKAEYFTHSNKLEMIWTVVPAIFLAVIIVFGLTTWNEIFDDAPDDAEKIELYSKQFSWLARYPGADGEFGNHYFKYAADNIDEITSNGVTFNDTSWAANDIALDPFDERSNDDIIVDTEFHLPVNKEVDFQFRSQDVIHSAYMPHFRAQMNTVPGMITKFHFKPTKTSVDMRNELGDPEFDYVLMCNKICGSSHFNMRMTIIVETEEEYQAWLDQQMIAKDRYQWEKSNWWKEGLASMPTRVNEPTQNVAENTEH